MQERRRWANAPRTRNPKPTSGRVRVLARDLYVPQCGQRFQQGTHVGPAVAVEVAGDLLHGGRAVGVRGRVCTDNKFQIDGWLNEECFCT